MRVADIVRPVRGRRAAELWVATAAAVVGVLIAAISTGTTPQWWLTGVVIAVAAAVTIFDRIRNARARSSAPTSANVRSDHARRGRINRADTDRRLAARRREWPTSDGDAKGVTEKDWFALTRICEALDRTTIHWLRSTEFGTPWLNDHVGPIAALLPLVADSVDRPFDADLHGALSRLGRALAAFSDFYDAQTFPDPLVRGTDWRFFDWETPSEPPAHEVEGELLDDPPAILRMLCIEIADAYDEVSERTAERLRAGSREGTRGRFGAAR
jgi:hypothetical protein